MKLALIFDNLFQGFKNTLIVFGIIIILLVFLFFALKDDVVRKVMIYIAGVLVIVAGIYSSINLYKEVNAKSYINGEIPLFEQFQVEDFSYCTSQLVLSKAAGGAYTYEVDTIKVKDFDGTENSYKVYLNEKLMPVKVNAGSFEIDCKVNFLSTENETLNLAHLKIQVSFLSETTKIKIATTTQESAGYLQKYFLANGFSIKAIKEASL